jgi:hypothetical protein
MRRPLIWLRHDQLLLGLQTNNSQPWYIEFVGLNPHAWYTELCQAHSGYTLRTYTLQHALWPTTLRATCALAVYFMRNAHSLYRNPDFLFMHSLSSLNGR